MYFACVYDATQDNMFCVAWGVLAVINFNNFKNK